nr:hypothetical protein [bacterium]
MDSAYDIFHRQSFYYNQEVEKMKWEEYFKIKKEYKKRNKK